MKILEGISLTKVYRSGWIGGRKIPALIDVTISLEKGGSLSIIGESGAGKTTLAKVLLGITTPTKGRVIFNGKDVTRGIPRNLRRLIGYIPQHPESALDPRWKLYDSIIEPLRIHRIEKRREQVKKIIERVSLDEDVLQRRPHEVSGGELQRAVIASSLIIEPILLICDEPTSMLDASTQADILRLIRSIKEDMNLSYLFISHNVDVASFMGDRIGVMLAGRLIELAPSRELLRNPLHPYTEVFINRKSVGAGESTKLRGCPFYDRCPHRMPICKKKAPKLEKLGEGHYIACYRYHSED